MSHISQTCGGQDRAAISVSGKSQLLEIVARRACATETPVLKALLPKYRSKEISYLRNRRGEHFGWERLLYAAERLGIRVELSISEAA